MTATPEVTTAVGDYLKRLYFLQGGDREAAPVATGDLAKSMDVSPPSATAMVRRLKREELVEYEPYRGVRLTKGGYDMAVTVIRKHRLVETLLHEVIGLDWTEVHAEAELLEHSISDKLLAHIDRYLGHPASDPHGDPIPGADGELRHDASRRLTSCAVGEEIRIARVTRQDGDFLRYLSEQGLRPGVSLRIVDHQADAGVLTVASGDTEIRFATTVAQFLLVE